MDAAAPRLILASASPARRRLLQQAAIPHRVQVSGVDEEAITASEPALLVQRLALVKAEAVAQVVTQALAGSEPAAAGGGTAAVADSAPAPALPVLGCDSLLLFEGEVFGKPATAAEAERRWSRMAGAWGELLTGHCLWRHGQRPLLQTVSTRVQFAPLTPAEITAYVATGEPLQCAGGFALEGQGGLLVERIEGCFSNVIGLSLPLLRRWLQVG